MFIKASRWWLIGILFYFPFLKLFINAAQDNFILSNLVRFVDEITIAVFFPFALIKLFKNKDLQNRSYLLIAIPILFFCFFGLISGIINENPFKITIMGTLDYVKYFFIIFIYAAFFREFSDFRKIYRFLLILTLVISIGAILQEAWAMVFRYIIGKNILDPIVYLFRSPPDSLDVSPASWRFGILRTTSIILKNDWVGYLSLFILTVYLSINKEFNRFILIVLIGGILTTVSRSAYTSLLIMTMILILERKSMSKKLIMAVVIFFIVIIPVLSFNSPDVDQLGLKEKGAITYRDFVRLKGMEIWKDHPFVGIGPGMFGGAVANYFVSPIYELYNLPFSLVELIGGLDQFWPQVYAETGIIGLILFVGIIIAFIISLLLLKRREIDEDIKNLLSGLLAFLLIIYIYTFGTGFNSAAVVFPYFAFIGMAWGSINSTIKKKCIL